MDQDFHPIDLHAGAMTDVGKVREENQDRFDRFSTPFGEVFVVADGMGGHMGGSVAAQMAVEGFRAHLSGLPPETPPDTAIRAAGAKTNSEIYGRANSGDPKTAKMGATVVLALLTRDGHLITAHVGDSRAYCLRNGRLALLTRDDSWVQRMVDHKILSEAEARKHPDSGVLTKSLGQKPSVELTVSTPMAVAEGDAFLLCTDGLTRHVDHRELESLAASGDGDPDQTVEILVKAALQAGGEDNVTVQYFRCGDAPAAPPAPPAAVQEQESPTPAFASVNVTAAPKLGLPPPEDALGAGRRRLIALGITAILMVFALGYLALVRHPQESPAAPELEEGLMASVKAGVADALYMRDWLEYQKKGLPQDLSAAKENKTKNKVAPKVGAKKPKPPPGKKPKPKKHRNKAT